MEDMSRLTARLDEFVKMKLEYDAIPGLAMAVTDREADLHVESFGVSSASSGEGLLDDTLFQIGSIGKSFTSIALLQLHEREKVEVGRPVRDYLPWFEVRSRHAPITLHHLMTHTAGIPIGSDATLSPEGEVWGLRHLETSAPPGEHFHYSNTGYKALGLVLEAVTGKPYADVITDGILDPLGMTDTAPVITNSIRQRSAVGHTWQEDDRPAARNGRLSPAVWFESNTGDGSISSTPRDMSKYLRMLLNKGTGPGGPLISERSFDLLTSRHIFCGEDGNDEYYGYGICVEESLGRTVYNHTGGMVGYTSSMLIDMDLGLGIIVLTNSRDEPHDVSRFFLRLLDASVKGASLPEVELQQQRCKPEAIEDYAGDYRGASATLEVRERDGVLYGSIDGEEAPMECVKKDHFRFDHPGYRLFLVKFIRLGDKVIGAAYGGEVFHQGLTQQASDEPSLPKDNAAFVGHYRSHNPWLTNFRVVSRGGALLLVEPLGTEQVLVPTGGSSFRVGEDPRSPETVSFEMILDNKALVANLSGGLYYRTFTP